MIIKVFSQIGLFFLYILSFVPFAVLYFFSNLMYFLVYYVIRYRKKVVRENLRKSFPEKDAETLLNIEKKFFRYFTDLMFEVIKLKSLSENELRKRVKFNGLDQLEKHFSQSQSVLVCMGHYGNWEMLILGLGLKISGKTYIIYKPLNSYTFEEWFKKLRNRFGNLLVPMRQTLRMIIATKDEPTVFCFGSDQSPLRGEVQYTLQFLNQPTAVLMGLEKIAIQTNKPVYYFDLKRVKRGFYEVDVLPLCLDPKETKNHEITDLFFEFLNTTIQREPSYWLWSHKRWKLNN